MPAIILHGDAENLTPEEAATMVLRSSGLDYRVEEETFFVGQGIRDPGSAAGGGRRACRAARYWPRRAGSAATTRLVGLGTDRKALSPGRGGRAAVARLRRKLGGQA
ncbi:MAG: hypothetical protein GY856_28380 [bacterium]|nr:hypothetical protein [bacterium]